MQGHDIIVIGASAGGVEALTRLVAGLPGDLNASIFIVLHVAPHAPSVLPRLLNRHSSLEALHPIDGQEIVMGKIYVAPPDFHLLMKPGGIRLVRGPRENGHRPAVDPLFRSAAATYGGRVIGVILSGTLDDGTAGLVAIKKQGGLAVVQSPEDAMYSGMPRSAIEHVDVDHVAPLEELPAILAKLVNEEADRSAPALPPEPSATLINVETNIAEMDPATYHGDDRPGTPSSFGCPDCGGTLWELHDGDLIRFRCRTGHAFSADFLLSRQSDSLEEALWVAVRALEERASLSRRLGERMGKRGNSRTAERMTAQAEDSEQKADLIRQILLTNGAAETPESSANHKSTGKRENGDSSR